MSSRSPRMNGYRTDRMEQRPPSEQMVDLHVYLVPPEIWREKYNNALNQNINDTISVGLIRVHPETRVYVLRDEIEQQLGADVIPREYVFLKSVGRSLTRLKSKQEYQLKAKSFLPPLAYCPELYLLEATPEVRAALAASSSEGSTRAQSRTSYQDYDSYRGGGSIGPNQPPVPPITSPRRPPQEKQPPLPQHQEEYLPPLSATPPHSESPKQNKHTADSGIAGLTPEETHRENNVLDSYHHGYYRDRRKPVEDRLEPPDKPEEEAPAEQWAGPPERQEARQEERRPDNYRREEERPPPQQEPELQKNASDEELKRFPSPPPLRLASPDTKRDSDSARQRRQKEKEQLLKELERAREARRVVEKQREELVRRAKQMQNKTQNRRNHARDLWKKRYFEEKKKTIPLEEQCNRLRHELEIIHKKLMTTLEGPKEKATKLQEFRPSPKNNHKIQATRLQHEIDDIRRRVENAKMRLTGEMKLRNQAETELRALRAELTQKKINLTLSRHSQLTAYAPPVADVNMFTPRPAGLTPRS